LYNGLHRNDASQCIIDYIATTHHTVIFVPLNHSSEMLSNARSMDLIKPDTGRYVNTLDTRYTLD